MRLNKAFKLAGITGPPMRWDRFKKLHLPANPQLSLADDPRDPVGIGYDQQVHAGLAAITEEADSLVYSSGGTDSVALSNNRVITAITITADPYRHDVTTGTITVVQDAMDKILSGLNIVGGPTYFSLNNTLTFLKALGNLNKLIYPGLGREDLATGVGADNDSFDAWHIPFGALSDNDPFDILAGIPAEDETSLNLLATFGANNIIAVTAADGTVDTATRLRVLTYGVQGLSREYRARLPIPDFRHDHQSAPTTNTRFDFVTSRYLKRTTILNLAVAASNNEARNDSNITDVSVVFEKPTRTTLFDRIRWRTFKNAQQVWSGPGTQIDKDGSAAVAPGGLVGIAVIDWRDYTHNPYGLNLYPFSDRDVHLDLTMGTTTGSVHLFNEYYAFPDPSVAQNWPPRQPL